MYAISSIPGVSSSSTTIVGGHRQKYGSTMMGCWNSPCLFTSYYVINKEQYHPYHQYYQYHQSQQLMNYGNNYNPLFGSSSMHLIRVIPSRKYEAKDDTSSSHFIKTVLDKKHGRTGVDKKKNADENIANHDERIDLTCMKDTIDRTILVDRGKGLSGENQIHNNDNKTIQNTNSEVLTKEEESASTSILDELNRDSIPLVLALVLVASEILFILPKAEEQQQQQDISMHHPSYPSAIKPPPGFEHVHTKKDQIFSANDYHRDHHRPSLPPLKTMDGIKHKNRMMMTMVDQKVKENSTHGVEKIHDPHPVSSQLLQRNGPTLEQPPPQVNGDDGLGRLELSSLQTAVAALKSVSIPTPKITLETIGETTTSMESSSTRAPAPAATPNVCHRIRSPVVIPSLDSTRTNGMLLGTRAPLISDSGTFSIGSHPYRTQSQLASKYTTERSKERFSGYYDREFKRRTYNTGRYGDRKKNEKPGRGTIAAEMVAMSLRNNNPMKASHNSSVLCSSAVANVTTAPTNDAHQTYVAKAVDALAGELCTGDAAGSTTTTKRAKKYPTMALCDSQSLHVGNHPIIHSMGTAPEEAQCSTKEISRGTMENPTSATTTTKVTMMTQKKLEHTLYYDESRPVVETAMSDISSDPHHHREVGTIVVEPRVSSTSVPEPDLTDAKRSCTIKKNHHHIDILDRTVDPVQEIGSVAPTVSENADTSGIAILFQNDADANPLQRAPRQMATESSPFSETSSNKPTTKLVACQEEDESMEMCNNSSACQDNSVVAPGHQRLSLFSESVVKTLEFASKWKSSQMSPFSQGASKNFITSFTTTTPSIQDASSQESAILLKVSNEATLDESHLVMSNHATTRRTKRRNGKPTARSQNFKIGLVPSAKLIHSSDDADPVGPSLSQSIMGADWRPTKSKRQNL